MQKSRKRGKRASCVRASFFVGAPFVVGAAFCVGAVHAPPLQTIRPTIRCVHYFFFVTFSVTAFMNGARRSIGIGKIVVELFSDATSVSVCR
jgi:hypothetical protein